MPVNGNEKGALILFSQICELCNLLPEFCNTYLSKAIELCSHNYLIIIYTKGEFYKLTSELQFGITYQESSNSLFIKH